MPAQLADIAISSAETAAMFGIEPRVAMLLLLQRESGKGRTWTKSARPQRSPARRRPELMIEGPIQYDAAVDTGVAKTKMPGSEVAGRATVFIFPDLNTGNNTYKAVQRSSGAVAIGPVLQGLNKPVNDLSRGCTVTDIVNTVAITAIRRRPKEGGSFMKILVINCGSSSIKYKLFDVNHHRVLAAGLAEKIGEPGSVLTHCYAGAGGEEQQCVLEDSIADHHQGLQQIVDLLLDPRRGVVGDRLEITAIGHRVVHGGEAFKQPTLIDDDCHRRPSAS